MPELRPWADVVAAEYAVHRDAVLATLRRRLGSAELAEDALQEAVAVALRLASDGRRPANLPAWLQTVALRRGIDLLRRHPPAAVLACEPADGRDVHEDLALREELQAVAAAAGALPERQRRALALQVLHGASVRDIAAELDVTPANARALVHRARRTLAERVEEAAELGCGEVRALFAVARSRGVRAPARAHRHVARCRACAAVTSTAPRARLAGVLGWLPWQAGLLQRFGPVLAGDGVAAGAKVCAGVCVAASLAPAAVAPPVREAAAVAALERPAAARPASVRAEPMALRVAAAPAPRPTAAPAPAPVPDAAPAPTPRKVDTSGVDPLLLRQARLAHAAARCRRAGGARCGLYDVEPGPVTEADVATARRVSAVIRRNHPESDGRPVRRPPVAEPQAAPAPTPAPAEPPAPPAPASEPPAPPPEPGPEPTPEPTSAAS